MMSRARMTQIVGTALLVAGLGASCVTGGGHGDLDITPVPRAMKQPMNVNEMIAAMDRYAPAGSLSGEALADLHLILRAQRQEAMGRGADAVRYWYDAMAVARGRFGEEALRGWIRAYTAAMGKKADADVLARLLLAETRQGRQSPYMVKAGLTKPESLAVVVRRWASEWLETPAAAGPTTMPVPAPGVPAGDPLLTKLTADRCRADAVDAAAWDEWQKTLPRATAMYWIGATRECAGDVTEAIRFYRSAFETGATVPAEAAIALEAQGHVIALLRSSGERAAAADAYMALVRQWEAPGVSAASMGLQPTDFDARRMDEILWAARYRAMISDHETAKVYAQRVVDLAARFVAEHPVFSAALREQVAGYRVDALHTIAFRSAVEQKDWDGALSLTLTALQTPDTSTEWRERLTWFAGLYEFMAGRHDDARRRWEAALKATRDDALRGRLYFWIGRALKAMKRGDEARHYLDLLRDEYPLSFYTVVGLPILTGKEGARWRGEGFPDGADLVDSLKTRRFPEADAFEEGSDMWRLIRRAEVLASIRMDKWARMAAMDLDEGVKALPGGVSEKAGLYVYLSRIHYWVGNYSDTIRLTSQLVGAVPEFWSKWPEQVIVYFPRPFSDAFSRTADAQHLEMEHSLGVSRQESSFNPSAKSPVGALGLMQLMPRTAARYADGLSVTADALPTRLVEPDINIVIGTTYLKSLFVRYKGVAPASYAAYNAGEFAVDAWLQRRPNEDTLVWIEMIPFNETKDYVKNVWRNAAVYRVLNTLR